MRLIPYVRKSEFPSQLWPETSRFFDEFFDSFSTQPGEKGAWVPPVDVIEKEGNVVLRAEIPGMNENDVELKLEGNVLTLKGERKLEAESPGNYHRIESWYGTFTRSFTLPETVDLDKIKAEYKNGLLIVTIPQRPEVRPREIPVKIS